MLIEKVKEKRLAGEYKRAFDLADNLRRQALKRRQPDIELEAIWELMDVGKVVYPHKKGLLRQLGKRSLLLAEESQISDLKNEAKVRWGALLRVLGQYQGAIKVLSAVMRTNLDPQLRAFALWNLGFAYRMNAQFQESRWTFLRALEIFRKIKDQSGIAYALCALAGITRLLGDSQQSLVLYQRALKLFRLDEDLYGVAYANCGTGNALRKLRQWPKAIKFYNRSQRLYRKLGDRVNEGYVRWGRSLCLRGMGLVSQAQSDRKWAMAIFRKYSDQRGLALTQPTNKKLPKAALQEASIS